MARPGPLIPSLLLFFPLTRKVAFNIDLRFCLSEGKDASSPSIFFSNLMKTDLRYWQMIYRILFPK